MTRWICIALLVAAPALGQTINSVSNSSNGPAEGDTLTIIGSDFGAKSPAAPMIWQNWDGLGRSHYDVVHEDSATTGFWSETQPPGDGFDPIRYWSDGTMSGSGLCVRSYYPDSLGGTPFYRDELWREFPDPVGFGDYLYINFSEWSDYPGTQWVYDNCGNPTNIQYKRHRIGSFGSTNNPQSGFGLNAHDPAKQFLTVYGVDTGDQTSGIRFGPPDDRGGLPLYESQWEQQIWEVSFQSDENTADGSVLDWHGGDERSVSGIQWCGSTNDPCDTPFDGVRLNLEPLGFSGCSGIFQWKMDNFYADSVKSRVILANSDTWSLTTKRHPQPPIYWASDGDSVQVIVNQADADSAQTWWVFLVTSTGSISSGYSVTMGGAAGGGGGGESSAPGAPSVNRGTGAISWSAAVPQPDHYTVWVYEDDILQHAGIPVDGSDTGITLTLSETAVLRTYVVAYDASNNIQSTSGTTYTAAP